MEHIQQVKTYTLKSVLIESILIIIISSVIALTFNTVRKNGIQLVQKNEYEILVPCPEQTGEVTQLSNDSDLLFGPKSMVIDARSEQEFKSWHFERAINLFFDFLEPINQGDIKMIISSGSQMVIVYGDGLNPDSGKELGKEISGKGIKNVFYIKGGAPLLKLCLEEGKQCNQ